MSTFILISAALLMLGKADLRLIQGASDQLNDGGKPLFALLSQPIVMVREFAADLGRLLALHEENARLREENARLLAWKARAVRLEVQNRFLSEIVKFPKQELYARSVSAQIIADSSPGFVQSRLLNVGLNDNVETGMAAVDADGLAGYVLHTSKASSRLLLLTDYTSRVPVLVGRTGEHAIMEGDNSPFPVLKFLPVDPAIRGGDEVLTSGVGGVLPAGVPVGELIEMPDSQLRVRPYVDWTRLNYLSLIKATQITPPKTSEGGQS